MINLSARSTLEDLILSHQMLEEETCPQRFRILWVAAISICRSIGSVLHKIDGPKLLVLQNAIKLQWEDIIKNRDKNLIFHKFINAERNNILKEYSFGICDYDHTLSIGDTAEVLDECIFVPLNEGAYAMEDSRDVIAEAIEWWSNKLSSLEQTIINAG